ncbi:hypothetical protein [Culicoidibacter larvae]|uniref:Uncharacterized protein n=1 Tax=Culicoidibacter larvae TaxID=2579976 RepID=A0A5R8QJ60_9FIRM|nr:hypothetical protein [Culicoidibacter larvae]TLG77483.1 hypothetical protein FEZ08_02350 [Culicoidibacter larvae]
MSKSRWYLIIAGAGFFGTAIAILASVWNIAGWGHLLLEIPIVVMVAALAVYVMERRHEKRTLKNADTKVLAEIVAIRPQTKLTGRVLELVLKIPVDGRVVEKGYAGNWLGDEGSFREFCNQYYAGEKIEVFISLMDGSAIVLADNQLVMNNKNAELIKAALVED